MSKAKPPASSLQDPSTAGPGGKRRKGDAAFDVWLTRGLHEMYDKVASEPIPEELLRLIEEDRRK